MEALHARVVGVVGVPLSARGALETALVCATAEAHDLAAYSHERAIRGSVLAHIDALAMAPAEFAHLFGVRANHAGTAAGAAAAALSAYEAVEGAPQLRERLEAALCQTLTEPAQRARWQSARVRVAASVALVRRVDYVQALSAVLGELVRADLRRLDDLRAETVEDGGIDIMLTTKAISALAHAVAP